MRSAQRDSRKQARPKPYIPPYPYWSPPVLRPLFTVPEIDKPVPEFCGCGGCGTVETIPQLVHVLGGRESVAGDLHTSLASIDQAIFNGHFGTGWHLRLFAKVIARGHIMDPAIFGFRRSDREARALHWLMTTAMEAQACND